MEVGMYTQSHNEIATYVPKNEDLDSLEFYFSRSGSPDSGIFRQKFKVVLIMHLGIV